MKKIILLLLFTMGYLHAQDTQNLVRQELDPSLFEEIVMIGQKGGLRAEMPLWFRPEASNSDIARKYPDSYVFVVQESGTNLNFLEGWVNKVGIRSVIIQRVANDVREFTISLESLGDVRVRAARSVLTNIAQMRLPGLQKEQDWWILNYYKTGPQQGLREYTYGALYLVKKSEMDTVITAEMQKSKTDVPVDFHQDLDNMLKELEKTLATPTLKQDTPPKAVSK